MGMARSWFASEIGGFSQGFRSGMVFAILARDLTQSCYSETSMLTFAKLETQKLLQSFVEADERLIRFQQAQRRWNNIVYTVWIAIIATTATTMYFTQHEWLPVLRNVVRAIS
jgi:hypothetical protein